MLNTTIPIPTQQSTQNCTAISDLCPVDQTIYGYYPGLGVNAFFCGAFGVLLAINLFQGFRFKTWTYLIAMFFGCLGETVGYVGRILLHNNPWSGAGFNMQICCLIIAPAFFSAAIYLLLKHLVLACNEELSPIPARYYTYIFIACDLLSLILQGAGGGLAATANSGSSGQNTGNDLMLTGICWQVITLFVFACLTSFYLKRAWDNRSILNPISAGYRNGLRFKLFCGAVVFAFFAIFVRCIYRIPEMSGGWRNSLMQNETDFIAMDSAMVLAASLSLTIFHPGYCFPQIVPGSAERVEEPKKAKAQTSGEKKGAWRWIRGGRGGSASDEKLRGSDSEV